MQKKKPAIRTVGLRQRKGYFGTHKPAEDTQDSPDVSGIDPQAVPRVPRTAKKPGKPKIQDKKELPSGRGISGKQIFVTGKKPTGSNELSGGRAKPTKKAA